MKNKISTGDRVVVAAVDSVDPDCVGITGEAEVRSQNLIWIIGDATFYGPYRADELEVIE